MLEEEGGGGVESVFNLYFYLFILYRVINYIFTTFNLFAAFCVIHFAAAMLKTSPMWDEEKLILS